MLQEQTRQHNKDNIKHNYPKGTTKEAPPWKCHQKSLDGLNMFNGTNLTLCSDVDQDTKMFGSNEIFLTPFSSTYKSRY